MKALGKRMNASAVREKECEWRHSERDTEGKRRHSVRELMQVKTLRERMNVSEEGEGEKERD